MKVLAQIFAQPPPRLPGPPMVEHALFENPLPVIGGLVGAAVIGAYLFNARGRVKSAAAVGAGLVVLAAAIWLLAGAVRTDREAIKEATVALVDAVARVDEPAMRRILAEDARLFAGGSLAEVATPAGGLDREQTIGRVRATLGGQYRLAEHRASGVQAAITGPGAARSQCRVRVVVEGWNFANNSYWRLDWRRDSGGAWRAYAVTPVSIDGLGATAP